MTLPAAGRPAYDGRIAETPNTYDVSTWFYAGYLPMLRVLVVGLLAYVALVAALRFGGKRTLSKMNAFDLVVTVAFGSILASTLLSKGNALLTGLTAFVTLIGLQWVVAWSCARFGWASDIVKSVPTILVWRGEMLSDVMVSERISPEEVRAAVRASGLSRVEDASAVVLETNGDLNVVTGEVGQRAPADSDEPADVQATALIGTSNRPGDE